MIIAILHLHDKRLVVFKRGYCVFIPDAFLIFAAASSSSSSSNSSTSAPATQVCPNLSCITPIILESRRVDTDSIFLSWGPYAGINTFVIRYGLENGNWLYSTTVTGFSTTLNDLPSNQPIWVLISPTDNCSIGPCGEAKLVGGPRLPNTGKGQSEHNGIWSISTGIVAVLSLLYLTKRLHTFSSTH